MNIDDLDRIIDEAIASYDQTRATGKVEAIAKILPHLRLVKDRSERERWMWHIVDRLKIDRRLMREEIERARKTKRQQ